MELAELRIFLTVVREGGINAAARKLNRVQSNVTTRIKKLEESLGVLLFSREGRRLNLSNEGKVLLQYAEELLDLEEKVRNEISGDNPIGTLQLGTLESTAASRLPPLLARFHKNHPLVRIELQTGTTDTLIERVADGEIDAAFVADFDRQRGDLLQGQTVFEEYLVLVTPMTHDEIKNPRDIQTNTVITFPKGCAYRRRIFDWIGSEGHPWQTLELASYYAIVACVASGTGIALVPSSVLRTINPKKAVKVHELPPKVSKTTTQLVRRKTNYSKALKAFVRLLDCDGP